MDMKYTKQHLDNVAKTGGMPKLREIGDKFEVKAVGMDEMITKIIEAQGPVIAEQPTASPLAPPDPGKMSSIAEAKKAADAFKERAKNGDFSLDGYTDILSAPDIPGWTQRWVTDRGGRVKHFEDKLGYQIVGNRDSLSSDTNSTSIGGNHTQVVNQGLTTEEGQSGILMKVPTEIAEMRSKSRTKENHKRLDIIKSPQKSAEEAAQRAGVSVQGSDFYTPEVGGHLNKSLGD